MGSEKHKSKVSRRDGRTVSALNVLLIIQLILMFILSIGITQIISASTISSSDAYMKTIADERSRIILNYVENAEKTLTDFSHAGEVLRVIENPSDSAAAEAAQKYTEAFSADIVNLEGIYISDWNTHVLAHTNVQTVGITTRNGENLKHLQDSLIKAGKAVYNTGIISSPATGKQIVSMYKAVYGKDGKPLGLVGLGVYTDGLVDVLDTLGRGDIEKSAYSMVNTSDGRYIFHQNENKVSAEADLPELRALIEQLGNSSEDRCGKLSYTLNGTKYISVYSYMSQRGWLFMIDETEADIYRLTGSMRGYLIVFCIFCFILIVLFNIINKKREETSEDLISAVEKHEKTKESLNNVVYNDFLTDIRNRISFASDFEAGKTSVPEDSAYYFALFNINQFSKVNVVYGEESGDMILVTTARLLNKEFPDARIYRTGSDEFLVAQLLPKGPAGQGKFLNSIKQVTGSFSRPFEAGETKINVSFSVAAAYRSRDVNISVLPALKDIMEMNPDASVSIVSLDRLNR